MDSTGLPAIAGGKRPAAGGGLTGAGGELAERDGRLLDQHLPGKDRRTAQQNTQRRIQRRKQTIQSHARLAFFKREIKNMKKQEIYLK